MGLWPPGGLSKRSMNDLLSTCIKGTVSKGPLPFKLFQPQDKTLRLEERETGSARALTGLAGRSGSCGGRRALRTCSRKASPGPSRQPCSSGRSQGPPMSAHLEPHPAGVSRGLRPGLPQPEPPPARWAPARVSLAPAPWPAPQSLAKGSLWARRCIPRLRRGCSMPPAFLPLLFPGSSGPWP